MNALRFLLVLPCISLLYSCTTHAYIKKEQTDKVEYTILEGSEFLILKEFKTEIEHCLGSNKTIGMQLRTIHPGLQDTSRIFIPSDSRFTSIPDRISRETSMFQFFLCMNPKGGKEDATVYIRKQIHTKQGC